MQRGRTPADEDRGEFQRGRITHPFEIIEDEGGRLKHRVQFLAQGLGQLGGGWLSGAAEDAVRSSGRARDGSCVARRSDPEHRARSRIAQHRGKARRTGDRRLRPTVPAGWSYRSPRALRPASGAGSRPSFNLAIRSGAWEQPGWRERPAEDSTGGAGGAGIWKVHRDSPEGHAALGRSPWCDGQDSSTSELPERRPHWAEPRGGLASHSRAGGRSGRPRSLSSRGRSLADACTPSGPAPLRSMCPVALCGVRAHRSCRKHRRHAGARRQPIGANGLRSLAPPARAGVQRSRSAGGSCLSTAHAGARRGKADPSLPPRVRSGHSSG